MVVGKDHGECGDVSWWHAVGTRKTENVIREHADDADVRGTALKLTDDKRPMTERT